MKGELVKRIVDLVEDCMGVAGIEEGRTLTERDVEDFLNCVERALKEVLDEPKEEDYLTPEAREFIDKWCKKFDKILKEKMDAILRR